MTNTGFYKMELDFLGSQKKTKTIVNIENNYQLFLSYLKKFLLFYYRINFNNDEEDKIINDIYIKKEKRYKSRTYNNEDDNNNNFMIKTQFNKSEYNKMTNTGFYKMELDFLGSQKKTKTIVNY